MTPIDKALWFINSHSHDAISLEDIANCAGVSRFHLLRAFGNATGQSIMRYVRNLRLAHAARRLAQGGDDILSIAIEVGYSSHEAFTRAFRECFGVTPETIRTQRHVGNLQLQERLMTNTLRPIEVSAPRFEECPVLLLAGVAERYSVENCGSNIPGQWQRFLPFMGHLRGQVGDVAYGVCYNFDDNGNMDYLCAVEVREFSDLPSGFARLRVAAQRYAVFFHAEHVSAIRSTWHAIWNEWLPPSGYEVTDAPFFERYDSRFDSVGGHGGVELWVPVVERSR